MRPLTVLLLLIAVSGFNPQANAISDLPVNALAALPRLAQPRLSPDGTQMIAFRPIDDAYHLVLLDLATMKFRLLMASDPGKFLFNWCNWANHERIVCSTRSATRMPRVVIPDQVVSWDNFKLGSLS